MFKKSREGKLSFEHFIFILTALSAVASLFCMLFISVAVGSRYLLGYSVPGMLDITQMMLVLMIFLPLAYVEKNRGHLQITILYSVLPKRTQSVLQFIWEILACILFALIAVMSFRGMVISFMEHEASWGDLAIPLWIPKLFIFVGCTSMFLYDSIHLFRPRETMGDKTYGLIDDITTYNRFIRFCRFSTFNLFGISNRIYHGCGGYFWASTGYRR
jgi:TRAP-type C4-dicarboxylate transport system permease small subunit